MTIFRCEPLRRFLKALLASCMLVFVACIVAGPIAVHNVFENTTYNQVNKDHAYEIIGKQSKYYVSKAAYRLYLVSESLIDISWMVGAACAVALTVADLKQKYGGKK